MKRIAGLLVVVALLWGCAGTREDLRFGFVEGYEDFAKPKFVKEYTIIPNEYYITRMVFAGESIDNWTEALEWINTWRKSYPPSIDGAYTKLTEIRKNKCPESTFSVIGKDNNSILYDTKTVNCPPNPDETSLTRILYGHTQVYVMIYTNKTRELPKEKRDAWIKMLSEARIRHME